MASMGETAEGSNRSSRAIDSSAPRPSPLNDPEVSVSNTTGLTCQQAGEPHLLEAGLIERNARILPSMRLGLLDPGPSGMRSPADQDVTLREVVIQPMSTASRNAAGTT